MNKRIILNGIELSLPKYNAAAVTFFDYLENVVSQLEKELNEEDGSFQLSINVDFSTNAPPHHQIHANGRSNKRTKDKVARVLNRNNLQNSKKLSGSVRVNLQVEDG